MVSSPPPRALELPACGAETRVSRGHEEGPAGRGYPLPKAATPTWDWTGPGCGLGSGCRGPTTAGLQRAPFAQAGLLPKATPAPVPRGSGDTQRVGLTCRQVANPFIGWVGPSTSQRLGSEPAAGSWAVTHGGIFDLQVSKDVRNIEVVVNRPLVTLTPVVSACG